MFSEKFDFILNLTNIQTAALAKACHLSPSYLSRLRGGTRPLPKSADFLPDLCGFLARHIRADYHRAVLCSQLKLPVWPSDEDQAAQLLRRWLTDELQSPPDLTPLLTSFTGDIRPGALAAAESAPDLPARKRYYFGAAGKQEAVLQFFHLILQEKAPQTLLLSSEEEMDWLYEDPVFAAKWARDFQNVILAGNRVKIIHSITRNMNELLEAVTKWIPIYTTGMVEPYYYSKLRDGIFRRTLFIAPNTAAIVSVSVGSHTDGMLNELITDKEAVAALTMEYENYLSLCRPLMRITTPAETDELWKACGSLIGSDGDIICMCDMPTLATMPEQVARSLQERAPQSRIFRQWRLIADAIGHLAAEVSYSELLPRSVYSPESDLGEVPLPCADLLGAPGLCYTEEEWRAHLESSLHFAETHKNYRQSLLADMPGRLCLFAREERGVVMLKSTAPGVAFAFSETNLLNAFWDYLTQQLA